LKTALDREFGADATNEQGIRNNKSDNSAADREISTSTKVNVIVKKYIGYRQQDEPIIALVTNIISDRGITAWAALKEIPDDDLPGLGAPDSRRKRILSRIRKA
jgi:hypothetical protein